MTSFDGTTLVMDTIKGVRQFDVDEYGRLEAVTMATKWKPGWNTAAHSGYENGHRVAGRRCACGFYAYFKWEDSEHQSAERVTGIIEGKGRVSASTKGFRVEQARIIALAPTKAQANLWWERIICFFLPPYSYVNAIISGIVTALGVKYDDVGWWGAPALVLTILFLAGSALGTLAMRSENYPLWVWNMNIPSEQRQLLARNYPDAKVYPNRKAMLRDFEPVKPPHVEVPFDPNHPDFWKG